MLAATVVLLLHFFCGAEGGLRRVQWGINGPFYGAITFLSTFRKLLLSRGRRAAPKTKFRSQDAGTSFVQAVLLLQAAL